MEKLTVSQKDNRRPRTLFPEGTVTTSAALVPEVPGREGSQLSPLVMLGAAKPLPPLPPFRNEDVSSVEMFVSGGQTGGDSIPLLVHDTLGVAVSGYMPRDFRRDDGRGRDIAARYGLTEGDGGFSWRDKKNAAVSDALIAFLTSAPLTGEYFLHEHPMIDI